MAEERLPHAHNLGFVEQLYSAYRRDAASVSDEWQRYFAELDHGNGSGNGEASPKIEPSFRTRSIFNPSSASVPLTNLQERVDQVVRAHRLRGHMAAQIDP